MDCFDYLGALIPYVLLSSARYAVSLRIAFWEWHAQELLGCSLYMAHSCELGCWHYTVHSVCLAGLLYPLGALVPSVLLVRNGTLFCIGLL